jgi:glycosyltransferase involved in cell wall biosynthesis/ADP-heptose:LPS heptosyltransferase/Flp pilus assembly protein TadD/predicted O-methyltransferase YrrM
MGGRKVKNIIISGTNFWNAGDDFVRDGVIRVLRELFAGEQLNFLFYNFNQDFFPQSKFSGISNTVARGDLEQYRDCVDAVVIAGLSAGQEIKDLYQWVVDNGLQDRVYLIGAGYENRYVDRYISQEPEATIFRHARVILGRTKKTPAFIRELHLPYTHVNCPAILSVPRVKTVEPGARIGTVGFSIQLPHEQGIVNHCCSAAMYALSVKILLSLCRQCRVEVVAHHKTEYFHFLNLLKGLDIPVIFSSFYQDLFAVYPRYDLVITTRLHASLFANGHGVPGIIINDTDRHTHCLEGFPHSVWVNSEETFKAAFAEIQERDLRAISLDAEAFKSRLLGRYLELLREPFGLPTAPSGPTPAPGPGLADALRKALADPAVKERVLGIIGRLTPDAYLPGNIECHRRAVEHGEGWFDSLVFLNWYAHAFKPRNYLEVGVRRGRSIAQVAVESPGTACYGFDMWIPNYSGQANEGPLFVNRELNTLGVARLPLFVVGNSHETLPLFFSKPEYPRSFDLIFIDGDHTYAGAKLDLDLAFEHLAPGGVLLFDDIRHVSHPELWPLWQEYKARFPQYLFLEDETGNGTACAFKPPFDRLKAFLSAEPDRKIPARPLSAGSPPASAVFLQDDEGLPVHFFTIVLNGQPFIRHHIDIFSRLPFRWHWHVVEGVAELKHDTAWSANQGGRITGELHRNGLSNDGTTEYLDEVAGRFPDRVTLYRKPAGAFWDGKIEMVRAPLGRIGEPCLLWEIDADELWTAEQICAGREMFAAGPSRTAAYYLCRFFVGERLVTTTRDTYGNHTAYEWLRTWRYEPGDQWLTHEPPRLCRKNEAGQWQDLASLTPFRHAETEAQGLVFQHFAYATEAQLRFKEVYYGYGEARQQWRSLNSLESYPARLAQHFAWVRDDTLVDTVESQGIDPVAMKDEAGVWIFKAPPLSIPPVRSLLWLRTDSIGDNVLAASMLAPVRAKFPDARITVVCQGHIAELYERSPHVDGIIPFDRMKAIADAGYRSGIIDRMRDQKADLLLSTVYSREQLTDVLALESGAKRTVAFAGDLCNISAEARGRADRLYSRLIQSPGRHRSEMERFGDFLGALGIDTPGLATELWLSPEDEAHADRFFAEQGLDPARTVALFAAAQYQGRSYGRFGEAVREICREAGLSLIALGSVKDAPLNQKALDDAGVRSVNLSGKTTLRQSAALLKRCRMALGVDTSLGHMACAVGTPNVVVLGGGHFGRFMPYHPLTSVVCLMLECYYCDWRCRYRRYHCVSDIRPEVIAAALRAALAGPSDRPRLFIQGQDDEGLPEGPALRIRPEFADPEKGERFWVKGPSFVPAALPHDVFLLRENSTTWTGEGLESRPSAQGAEEAHRTVEPLIEQGLYGEAEEALDHLVRDFPGYAPAHNDLGTLAHQRGDREKALRHYEAAAGLQPDHIDYLKNLADYHYTVQEDLEKAMSGYNRILAMRPAHVETLLAVAQLCIRIEKLEMSREFYGRALAADPGNEHAREALAMLAGILGSEGTNPGDPAPGGGVEALVRRDDPERAYRVSALVSTYNSERFLRGCLEDLEAQTIAGDVEIIVVDSASQQNERAIVEEFQQRYDNIVYLRTSQRETLYAAWNRAIRMARGTYITNTNTDDRRLPWALETEARALDQFPGVALVYADIWGTKVENDLLRPEEAGRYRLFPYPDFSRLNGLTGSNFSPQPMWRREVHESVGFFDETYRIAGDYEFFYRVARHGDALHITSPLGLYLENPGGIEKSQPQRTREEFRRLRRKFYGEMSLEEFFPCLADHPFDVEAHGMAWLELGNNCMIASVSPECDLAAGYYRRAGELLGDLPGLLHNRAMAHLGTGELQAALLWLGKAAAAGWTASKGALAELEKGTGKGLSEEARALFFPDHPVVTEARKGRGIAPDRITGKPSTAPLPEGGKEAGGGVTGITTIVVLADSGDRLGECLAAIQEQTPEPHELIVSHALKAREVQRFKKLPGGGQARWLEGRKGETQAERVNRALEEAGGEFVVLLRQEVTVTAGWLAGMKEPLIRQNGIGMVGPMLTNSRGRQGVEFPVRDGEDLAARARDHRERNRHRRVPSRRLEGACLLFRRECLGKTGLFDGKLAWQDACDDLALRFELTGLRNLIASDVFLGHAGPGPAPEPRKGGGPRNAKPAWLGCLSRDLKDRLALLETLEKADLLYQHGEPEQAVGTLVACIKITPEAREIYFEMARIFIESKRFSEAGEVLSSLPEPAMKDREAVAWAGYAREGLDRDAEAEACADAILDADGRHPAALNLKGVLAYKRGDREGAGSWFRKAMDADPGYGEAHANAGVLRWSAGQQDEAYGELKQGFILAPTVPDHGKLYYAAVTAREAFGEAQELFREAARIHPDSRNVAFLLIDALVQQGRHGDALEQIEEALVEFGSDDALLQTALALREQVGPRTPVRETGKATLSVCMIVKNEEEHLARCLKSVRAIADEVIVVDTGSTDRTGQIARAFGAKVDEVAWTGDFAAARNHSLSRATGDWIFVLDADETIAAADHAKLLALIRGKDTKPVAYDIVTRNYTERLNVDGWRANDGSYPREESGNGWYPSAKVRLFRRIQEAKFVNPVHECLEPSLLAAGVEIRPCPAVVHHYGRLGSAEKIQAKREAYYQLGRRKMAEQGSDPKVYCELALAAGELERNEEAIELWNRFIAADPGVPSAFVNLGALYIKLGRYDESLEASHRALALDPACKEAAVNYAHGMLCSGKREGIETLLEKVLQSIPDYIPANGLLATVCCLEGNLERAARCLDRIRSRGFDTTSYLCEQARNLISLGRRGDAATLLKAAVQLGHDSPEIHRMLGG